MKKYFFFAISYFFLACTAVAAASESGGTALRAKLKGVGETGAGFANIGVVFIAARVTRAALVLIGLIFFTLMIYGGSLWLTAGGNEEQVTKAKKIITRAVIGLLIVLFAGAISQFITSYTARPVAPPPPPSE